MGIKRFIKVINYLILIVSLNFSCGWCGTIRVFTDIIATWSEARSLCQSVGMDLIIINDADEMGRVGSCAADNGGFKRDCWIGGYWDPITADIRWLDNSVLDPSYPLWASGEPDCLPGYPCGSSTLQDCIRVTQTLEVRTMTCSVTYDVVCEAPNTAQDCISPLNPLTTPQTSNKKKGLSVGAIIGLVAGFVSFIVIVAMCCCVWKTFCGITEEDKIAPDPRGIHSIDLSEGACQQIATDNPWLQHEEVSFCLRNKYTFEADESNIGPRFKYIR